MFHIDSGSLHHIENIGTDVAEFIIAFRNERPEDFGLGASFGAMTDAVLGNTYDLPASDFATIRRDTTDHKLAARTAIQTCRPRRTSTIRTSSTSRPPRADELRRRQRRAWPGCSSGPR